MRFFRTVACFSLAAASLSLGVPASAADANAGKSEISVLLDKLETSNCQFNRNGSWYTGLEARKHLEDKYQYLQKRGMATNADAFIDQAATASSMSGKAYLVRCSGKPESESAAWLREQLRQYRAAQKTS